jgi:hypothetical protein
MECDTHRRLRGQGGPLDWIWVDLSLGSARTRARRIVGLPHYCDVRPLLSLRRDPHVDRRGAERRSSRSGKRRAVWYDRVKRDREQNDAQPQRPRPVYPARDHQCLRVPLCPLTLWGATASALPALGPIEFSSALCAISRTEGPLIGRAELDADGSHWR